MRQSTSISVLFDDGRHSIIADIDNCISNITTAWHLDGLPEQRKHVHSFAVRWAKLPKYAYGSHLVAALADPHNPSRIHPTGSSLSLAFAEHWHDTMGFMDTILSCLKSHLAFNQINELKLADNLMPRVAFENQLAPLPMRHFILRNSRITDFLKIMHSDPPLTVPPSPSNTESEPSTPAGPHYFPALETITLEDNVELEKNGVEFLIAVLKRRPEVNRIKNLRIDDTRYLDCEDKRRILDALPALELQWDGHEGDFVATHHSVSQHLELSDSEEESNLSP